MPQNPFMSNVATNSTGVREPLATGQSGDLLQSALHGSKFNQAYNSHIFRGANAAGATLSAALATTYVGLCLSNPAGSGYNLALRRVGCALIVAPATFLALGLLGGYAAGGITVHTTPVTPLCTKLGSAAVAIGKLDAAATLVGTPAWIAWFANNAATGGQTNAISIDFEAGIIVPPGAYVAIGANAAGPAAGFLGSMEWEEIPVPA